MSDYRYQSNRRCDDCGRHRTCLYESSGPFRGSWLCHECLHESTEALADIIKAGQRLL